jgi:hypothetical protein
MAIVWENIEILGDIGRHRAARRALEPRLFSLSDQLFSVVVKKTNLRQFLRVVGLFTMAAPRESTTMLTIRRRKSW